MIVSFTLVGNKFLNDRQNRLDMKGFARHFPLKMVGTGAVTNTKRTKGKPKCFLTTRSFPECSGDINLVSEEEIGGELQMLLNSRWDVVFYGSSCFWRCSFRNIYCFLGVFNWRFRSGLKMCDWYTAKTITLLFQLLQLQGCGCLVLDDQRVWIWMLLVPAAEMWSVLTANGEKTFEGTTNRNFPLFDKSCPVKSDVSESHQ